MQQILKLIVALFIKLMESFLVAQKSMTHFILLHKLELRFLRKKYTYNHNVISGKLSTAQWALRDNG